MKYDHLTEDEAALEMALDEYERNMRTRPELIKSITRTLLLSYPKIDATLLISHVNLLIRNRHT